MSGGVLPNDRQSEKSLSSPARARRLGVALGVALLGLIVFYLLRRFATTLLLVFAGLLFGVFLDGLTNLVRARTRLPRLAALALVLLLLLAGFVGFCWLAGPRVVEQGRALVEQLPNSIDLAQTRLQQYDWGRSLLSSLPSLDELKLSFGSILGSVAQAFSITLELAGALVFIFFVGVYVAASPAIYRDGVLLLLAPAHRARGGEVLAAVRTALRWWLLGRAVTMALMGILTALALWLAQVPLALVLGVIAGLFLFVPYLGAVAAAIPAMLIGLMESPAKALLVGAIYTGVHLFEGYAITPFVQKRAVALPPALLLSVQVFAAALFGMIGVIFSTPLTVVAIVLVQTLYVQDVLGEKVALLGEHQKSATPPER
jgi:predicted PurR-regulated permease PerM